MNFKGVRGRSAAADAILFAPSCSDRHARASGPARSPTSSVRRDPPFCLSLVDQTDYFFTNVDQLLAANTTFGAPTIRIRKQLPRNAQGSELGRARRAHDN